MKYAALAELLRAAYGKGPISSLRDRLGPTDAEGAYAVQEVNTSYWRNRGREVVGRKIGLTSKAVQAQLGVGQPDFGVLFKDMEIEDGGVLHMSSVIQPRAEAEIALILGRDLSGTGHTIDDVRAAADCAISAIEIVDSRISDWKITFADTVADNGSSAYFVLGSDRRRLKELDLYTCGMALELNNTVVSIGAGAACLGHPLAAAAWLANTLSARGESLKAGDIVLTGALGPMITIKAGDHVAAQIGGLGRVRFSVEK
jgi:2-keto-4-pentenoate hydratase